jgi:hypothetical protein
VKIEIRFTADHDDDATAYPGMDGKTVIMERATELELSTSTDIYDDGKGGREAGSTGGLDLKAHGLRAMWSE